MPQVVSVETMRESDAYTISHGTPSKVLMYRAGRGIYESTQWKGPVAVVCGKGNNAGDGYVVADLLREEGIDCEIILLYDKFSQDGKYYYDLCMEHGIRSVTYRSDLSFDRYSMILDCLLGTGFSGKIEGTMKEVIEKINDSGAYVVSADINSRLDGNTGMGETYVKSDLTVSIGTFKYGHFIGLSDTAMKKKINVDIGIQIIGPTAVIE